MSAFFRHVHSAATSLQLADGVLQRQLREYLGALAGARTREQRSVYIDSTDAKGRKIAASYLIPTPIWKSSYRLIFQNSAPQPLLEGWAIIDNTTNDDWTNISLSLVSGKPISFQSRLYDPKFIERPFADLPDEQAAAPVQTRKTIKQTTQNVMELSEALAQGGARADLSIQGQGLEVASEAYRTSVGKLSIIAVDQKMSFFEAETGRKPKDYAEFMGRIIEKGKPDGIMLPMLPYYQEYAYAPDAKGLVVVDVGVAPFRPSEFISVRVEQQIDVLSREDGT